MNLFMLFLNFLWVTSPNIIAVLLGCMITVRFLPRRPKYYIRVTVSWLLIFIWVFVGKDILFPAIGKKSPLIPVIVYSGLYLFSWVSVMFWSEADWHQALFAVTVSYALQNICERLIEIPMLYWDWFPRQVIILLLALSLWLYRRFITRYQRMQSVIDFHDRDNRNLLFVAFGVMLVCVLLDLPLKGAMADASNEANLYICIIMALFSFLSIVVSVSHLRETDSKIRAEEAAQLLRSEQRRYVYDRQIHEAINIKCHDIRHQIAAMRSTAGNEAYRAELKKIGRLVDIYDAEPNTKNAALDVVLAGKMLTCGSMGITITCLADGRRLGFMSDSDVYALFGNILDNAIEAVDKIEDPELKMITLNLENHGDFLLAECQNYYSGQLIFDSGLPLTTKDDRNNHGFGTHSIRMLTEKYNGTLKISSQEDIFTLSILLPIPAGH